MRLSSGEVPKVHPRIFLSEISQLKRKPNVARHNLMSLISSEHQLDEQDISQLFLAVTYVDDAAPEIQGALTLTDYVDRIADIARRNDAGSLGYFEGRLSEAGYSNEHDYSDQYWLIGNTRWFHVLGEFPRLADSAIPDGLTKGSVQPGSVRMRRMGNRYGDD